MPEKYDALQKWADRFTSWLVGPVVFFREKVVEPNQKKYPWYHEKYRRVPTVDECYMDDVICLYEAQCQYERDRLVDNNICTILRNRYEDCALYNPEDTNICEPLWTYYEKAAANWMSKHGDLGAMPHVREALMKQKHRMIWERRHGPIGSGMKKEE